MTIPQALQIAVQHHQAGRLAEAETLYRQILAVQPRHAAALHFLGIIALQAGRHDVAAEWICQAIAIEPNNPVAHYNLGEAFRGAGRMEEAIASYRRALELKPGHAKAEAKLGVALAAQDRWEEAIAAYGRALRITPDLPEIHSNLGFALRKRGRFDEAIDSCRRALALKPDSPEALVNLGAAMAGRGQLEEAIAAYRSALQIRPDLPEAHNNLGNALAGQGKLEEAADAYHRALALKPDYPEACNNLGNALKGRGELDEAIAAYRRALALKPGSAEACNNLGNALRDRGQTDEAEVACRHAIALRPGYPEAHVNLGNALWDRGQCDEAIAMYRRALALKPDYPEAYNNLGNALKDQGQLDEAIAAYRRALQIKPEDANTHSNLVFTLHFHPSPEVGAISEEHRRWNRRFRDPVGQYALPHANDRSRERRLRLGYVSPDFRDHPVGRYVLPLFERHDRERFEVLCYSGVVRPDGMTGRLRALAAEWRNTVGVPDARLAEMIREDGVDILVDLAMHTAGNRLPVFARQPAPVQVAWLACPGSTGLDSIGYRLTDARMDPLGEKPAWSAEEPVRLPDCWCCYDPVDESPEVNALPAFSAGGVTFGSLNNFAKVNEGGLARWAKVLDAVRGSRIVMLCPEGQTRERAGAFLREWGIGAERVEWVGHLPRREYLRLYQRIDIALDPFPFNGMTTTCDALWMGAPVLTLPGAMPVSRAGLSILSSMGLEELVTSSEEDYVRMAVELAGDLPRLADLRATLRARMRASPLMDAPRFARNVEAAYRKMWERWRARSG